MTTHLLIKELGRLKESSKEAVANSNTLFGDGLKNYLHVNRPVERALIDQIKLAADSDHPVLLMVCGNVGDGKSHLLSRLRSRPELKTVFEQFIVHNDATESFSPDESCLVTLSKLLTPFRDDRLDGEPVKILLAINLGTLSNFLEDQKAHYSRLKHYVEINGIIDAAYDETADSSNGIHCFRHVNFANYHFYSLTPTGPQAGLIDTLLERITANHAENTIFSAYQRLKEENVVPGCPVIANYEFLMSSNNRKTIAKLLVACLVKEKQIISFRQLLNFVHDLIVPHQLEQSDLPSYRIRLQKLNQEQRIAVFLPYFLFEHPQRSKIFLHLHQLDPAIRRYEALDEEAVLLFTQQYPLQGLYEQFANLLTLPLTAKPEERFHHEFLTKLLLRLQYFQLSDAPRYHDDYFTDYLTALYAYNAGDGSALKLTFELIKRTAFRWNGGTIDKRKAVVPGTMKTSSYRVFRQVDLKSLLPDPVTTPIETLLDQFQRELKLEFRADSKKYAIAIDYALYVLLRKIDIGYRPNKIDRQTYVNFGRFVEQVTFADIAGKPLFIDEVNFGLPLDYRFEFNDEYGEFTFTSYQS